MTGTMVRLAHELDTTLQGLLRDPVPGPITPDAVQVEAALLAAKRRLSVTELQAALRFDKARLLAALDALSDALIGTGAQLSAFGGRYTIGPREGALDKATRLLVKTVRDGRSELNVGEARMLRRVMRGDHLPDSGPRVLGGAARAQIGALLENEFIHEDAGGFALNPEVEYSLGIRARPRKPRGTPTTRTPS